MNQPIRKDGDNVPGIIFIDLDNLLRCSLEELVWQRIGFMDTDVRGAEWVVGAEVI